MTDLIISALHINFPSNIEQLDNAYCSKTKGEMMCVSAVEAGYIGSTHSQGPIRVVGAWDPDPENNNTYSSYIGLDADNSVWFFNICHGRHWVEEELIGHPNHNNGLVYDMKWMWEPVECMGKEFWDEFDLVLGQLVGGRSSRTSVELDGFYPSVI